MSALPRWLCPTLLLLASAPAPSQAQATTPSQPQAPAAPGPAQPASDSAPGKPLPDVAALMRQVEVNERAAEALQQNYIYRQFIETDENDSKGQLKKRETVEAEVFWLNGVEVRRVLKRDGKDLTADEKQKEDARIDKRVVEAKARRAKADAAGKETDSHGHEEITVSRVLELGAFSNERRETINGRDTIVVDYAGDPHAKTRNSFENVFRELGGTVWIDEQDKAIQHLEGRFLNDFKMGGGLIVDLHKGTSFQATFSKVNNEVWLPQSFGGQGSVRALLFVNIHGTQAGRNSDYRKFKATSTLLPAFSEVDSTGPQPPDTTPPPPPPSAASPDFL